MFFLGNRGHGHVEVSSFPFNEETFLRIKCQLFPTYLNSRQVFNQFSNSGPYIQQYNFFQLMNTLEKVDFMHMQSKVSKLFFFYSEYVLIFWWVKYYFAESLSYWFDWLQGLKKLQENYLCVKPDKEQFKFNFITIKMLLSLLNAVVNYIWYLNSLRTNLYCQKIVVLIDSTEAQLLFRKKCKHLWILSH